MTKYNRKDVKPFLRGWKECFKFLAKGEGKATDHLKALSGCLLYPILWPVGYLCVCVLEKRQ